VSEEKKKIVQDMAEKFVNLEENDKAYISGYMQAKQEEREKRSQLELVQ